MLQVEWDVERNWISKREKPMEMGNSAFSSFWETTGVLDGSGVGAPQFITNHNSLKAHNLLPLTVLASWHDGQECLLRLICQPSCHLDLADLAKLIHASATSWLDCCNIVNLSDPWGEKKIFYRTFQWSPKFSFDRTEKSPGGGEWFFFHIVQDFLYKFHPTAQESWYQDGRE